MKILHLDSTHSYLYDELEKLGYTNHFDFKSSKKEIEKKLIDYSGVIIRSRFTIDQVFLNKAINLKFIVRIGSGIENIDVDFAKLKNIKIISTPEGNSNAVGEHAIGMLLSLMNNINKSEKEVSKGIWSRESNRGNELQNKTVGLIGYGNTGKSFSKKLSGFNVKVIFFDIKTQLDDENAKSVSLKEIHREADVISLHTSLTKESINLINQNFINKCAKPFWLINTARGKCINTNHLIEALKEKKILGAALDVLEFEKSSFEKLSNPKDNSLKYLIESDNVIITPHIAGWTKESKVDLVKVAIDKIKNLK
ncbi:MAG: NAD(P)-dependent oxidoreductase [Flavobacteriales bacterium]|jgi:D-3-phosphoglycerate dehydrogenase|tara:strand:- start:8424 stop:9353 length:930 start_codon:yes stop_codon:yes gene_type:complete